MTSSGKVRIYELSKDLGLENKDVLDAAEKLSIAAKSHSSSISDDEAAQIRSLIKGGGNGSKPAPAAAEPKKAILSVKKAAPQHRPLLRSLRQPSPLRRARHRQNLLLPPGPSPRPPSQQLPLVRLHPALPRAVLPPPRLPNQLLLRNPPLSLQPSQPPSRQRSRQPVHHRAVLPPPQPLRPGPPQRNLWPSQRPVRHRAAPLLQHPAGRHRQSSPKPQLALHRPVGRPHPSLALQLGAPSVRAHPPALAAVVVPSWSAAPKAVKVVPVPPHRQAGRP